jgi:hypothetical protein
LILNVDRDFDFRIMAVLDLETLHQMAGSPSLAETVSWLAIGIAVLVGAPRFEQ